MLSQAQTSARYHVQAVDMEYYKRNIPCQYACPAHTDARGYVNAIARGDMERAYYIARQPNPLATACGRICVAPCEAACRRGKVDSAIPIRALKRFVTRRYGVEGDYHTFPWAPPGNDNSRTFESQLAIGDRRGEGRVAVVGSGPAGLSAAHDLALLGYGVTMFEALPSPGGYMATALPAYRLSRELIRREVEAILRLGVEAHTSSPMEPEAVAALKNQGYRAVFVATGLEKKQRPFFPEEGVFTEAGMGVEGGGIIHAVAIGHRAARTVDAFLIGKRCRIQTQGWLEPVDPSGFFDMTYLHTERKDPRLNPFTIDGELEAAYTDEEAVAQARRCLTCSIQTVFDGQKCILCGGCVDVCPMNCLKLVGIDQVYGETPVTALMEEETPGGRRPVAAMIKDENRCIRCGLCHRRCPTAAVQLVTFRFEEEVVYD
ncbi:MAG: 4Fe-4S binding protein [Dehalococcoidia bacterium]|nr:4Fe-4S binding protein [Dehalococcoidia bacterium]